MYWIARTNPSGWSVMNLPLISLWLAAESAMLQLLAVVEIDSLRSGCKRLFVKNHHFPL